MSRFATCILAVLCCFAAFGETVTDSVKVYFRLNQAIISPNVGENAVLMDSFVNRVAALNAAGDLMSVSISGHASPEGPLKLNERLALKRGEALATELIKYATIDPRIITIKPGGIAWSDLRHLVLASDELADHREAILQILDIPDLNSAERLSRLKQVDNGKSYTIMFNNLFPLLRYTKAVAYFHRQPDTLVTDIDVSVDTITNSPFIANQDSLVAESKPNIDFTPPHSQLSNNEDVTQDDINYARAKVDHLLALKTNLLYYGILMPNISLECLFLKNWSVTLEGNMAWWSNESKLKCYRIATVDAEGRYWIRPRDYWHGFYVGAFIGGGLYDLENGANGHQGEGIMTGATVGFMWPIRRNLSFEVGLGAGYLYTRDREYKPFEGHYVYQRTRSIHYVGPLKVKFSLVWRFLDRNRLKEKGGRRLR